MNHWCESCARKNLCYVVNDRPKCFVPITNTTNRNQTDYDKGLQLLADIMFDKKKSEQFFKECKAMGVEPQTERSE